VTRACICIAQRASISGRRRWIAVPEDYPRWTPKAGHRSTPENRPGWTWSTVGDGQRLDRQQETASIRLGRLGWSLRASKRRPPSVARRSAAISRAAGVAVRGRGGQPKEWPPKPASPRGVSTDPGPHAPPRRAPGASACEPYREPIAEALAHDRNAMAGHLAKPRRRSRIHCALRQCPTVRPDAARRPTTRRRAW
jgi:hypothetical protein